MSHSIRSTTPSNRALRGASLPTSALALALSACSGGQVNLGEGEMAPAEPLPSYSRCLESPILAADVVVTEQSQIDELEGCETIRGDLNVEPQFYPDLRPLHALKTVTGSLSFTSDDTFALLEYAGKWLGSLEGLDHLEQAGSLSIFGGAMLDLQPLSRLRTLTGDGRLDIELASNLRDLAPLAQLEGVRSLLVGADLLESIADVRLLPHLEALTIYGPRLTDVDNLTQVRSVSGSLQVSGSGLSDMSALSGLEQVGSLVIDHNEELLSLDGLQNLAEARSNTMIWHNPKLVDVTGLTGLQSTDELEIYENASLTYIPDFPLLTTKKISIQNNSALEEVAQFTGNKWSPSLVPGVDRRDLPGFSVSNEVLDRAEALFVAGNPLLQQYAVPAGWRGVSVLAIANNANLQDLDLGNLASVDVLSIKANLSLASVDHSQLASVDLLSVLGNPALPLESFDGVQTFQREMSSDPVPAPNCVAGGCAP